MTDQAHKWTDKQIANLEKKIHKIYSQANKDMIQKQKSTMAEYERLHKEFAAQYQAGQLSKKTWNKFLNEYVMTERWFYETIETLSKNAVETANVASALINSESINVFAENYNWSTFWIEKTTHVNTMFTLVDSGVVRRMIKDNPQLLPQTTINQAKTYMWNARKFQSAITQGILQGEPLTDIAKRISDVTGMNERAAYRNARTAMTAAQNGGRLEGYERAANMGIAGKKRWMATLDSHTRDSHVLLDGEAVEYNETFSNGLMYPGDPDTDDPAEVYNCRCTMIYDVNNLDFSSMERNNRLGDMSYDEWKEAHRSD